LISTPLIWKFFDSHIEVKVYKEGATPTGDQFSIWLNTVVDVWVGVAREGFNGLYPQCFYPESGVMVQMSNYRLIYGDICK